MILNVTGTVTPRPKHADLSHEMGLSIAGYNHYNQELAFLRDWAPTQMEGGKVLIVASFQAHKEDIDVIPSYDEGYTNAWKA